MSKERRVPLTNSFSQKYDMVIANNRLKQTVRVKLTEDKVNQVGLGYLGGNIFEKDINELDIQTYEY